jgi:(S)-mandelate dehydrogenase
MLDCAFHPRWTLGLIRGGSPRLANYPQNGTSASQARAALIDRRMHAGLSWDDLSWLRQMWPRQLLVKGILRADDAVRCIDAGADGVILSNHGGRQLGSCISPLEILAQTRRLTTAPILIDSGFRSGSDIVKALALGANAVLLGRPALYALAAAGETGVNQVLALLADEIDRTLALIGCASISELSEQYLAGSLERSSVCHPAFGSR